MDFNETVKKGERRLWSRVVRNVLVVIIKKRAFEDDGKNAEQKMKNSAISRCGK